MDIELVFQHVARYLPILYRFEEFNVAYPTSVQFKKFLLHSKAVSIPKTTLFDEKKSLGMACKQHCCDKGGKILYCTVLEDMWLVIHVQKQLCGTTGEFYCIIMHVG